MKGWSMKRLPEVRPETPSQRVMGGGVGKAVLVVWWLAWVVVLVLVKLRG